MTIPGSSYSNERSFSILRRLKNYLRSTIMQNRLNHIAILHCYPDAVDKLNMEELMNEFISRNTKRTSVFALHVYNMYDIDTTLIINILFINNLFNDNLFINI